MKYIVVHCRHEGCYEHKSVEDIATQTRMTSIRINPPKLFVFDDKESAGEFFEEYMADVDCVDIKCKVGDDVEHADYCTCGIVEMDEEGYPIMFYNKIHQIFITEISCNVYEPLRELKHDICSMNLTNRLIRRCRKLTKEQRDQYIELGRMCQTCEKPPSEPELESALAPTTSVAPAPSTSVAAVPSTSVAAAPTTSVAPVPTTPTPTEPTEKKPKKTYYIKKADRVPNST